jgi:hypothetical protein
LRKAISTICAVAFLSTTVVTLTPAPASALVWVFFAPAMWAKQQEMNAKTPAKPAKHHGKKRSKM